MLKLKLQYFGHLMRRADSFEKTLMLGQVEGRRRRGWQRMKWWDDIINSMDMNWANSGRWWRTGKTGMLQSMGLQRVGIRLSDWTTKERRLGWGHFCHLNTVHAFVSVQTWSQGGLVFILTCCSFRMGLYDVGVCEMAHVHQESTVAQLQTTLRLSWQF